MEELDRIREYFEDRADASCEPGDDRFRGNREMSLLQDVEAVTRAFSEETRLRKHYQATTNALESWVCLKTHFTGDPPYVGDAGLVLALDELRAYAGQLEADARSVVRAYNSRKDATLYMAVEGLCATLDNDPAQPALGSLSSPQTGAQPERHETGRDWTEDAAHENGNYQNQCVECGEFFIGHKRRHVCKLCVAAYSGSCHQSGKKSEGGYDAWIDTPRGLMALTIASRCDGYTQADKLLREAFEEGQRHQVRQQCACDGRHPDGSPRGNCSYPLCDTGRLDSQSAIGKKS